MPNDPSTWMTPDEVVDYVRGAVTLGTLRHYRSARIGPSFVKVGRAVFYPAPAVHQWLADEASAAEDRWHDRA